MLNNPDDFHACYGISFTEAISLARPALVKLSAEECYSVDEFKTLNLSEDKYFLYKNANCHRMLPAVCPKEYVEFVAYLDTPDNFDKAIATQIRERKHSNTVTEFLEYLGTNRGDRFIDAWNVIWYAEFYNDGLGLRSLNTKAILPPSTCNKISIPGLMPSSDDLPEAMVNPRNAQNTLFKEKVESEAYYEDAYGVIWEVVRLPENLILEEVHGDAWIDWETLGVIEIPGLGLINTLSQRNTRSLEFQ